MAELKTAIVPLNGKNYPTWKVQCKMALMKDSLWGIVNETETLSGDANEDARKKFKARKDRALAIIVLAVDPSLLYMLGNPQDPTVVWNKLEEQFQRKTWSNKLQLRRKLFSLKLKQGESVHEHTKAMTEVFEALAVIGDAVSEEDQVVYLLASLPASYDMLVTALEAQSENVPRWELVTERLRHEEQKQKEKTPTDNGKKLAFVSKQQILKKGDPKKHLTCHFCKKPGHFKRDCRKFLATQQEKRQSSNAADAKKPACSESEREVLVTTHALTASSRQKWIVDSGATCHMCNDKDLFSEIKGLETPQEITLGDGHVLQATAEGTVTLTTLLPDGNTKECELKNVLLVPKLSYSLLSVSKASEAGKITKFDSFGCEIINNNGKVIAFATRVGNLYCLEVCRKTESINLAVKSKEVLWHRRYGHIGEQKLQKMVKSELVKQFDYDASKGIGFCETCIGGKHHRTPFDSSKTHSTELLELVHSDVCGKISEKSLGGAQYFLTFTDDKSRYSWVYILKSKDQVFDRFLEWKALVEKSSMKKIKTLRTDNGGEYTSTKFATYLKNEGIRHELTVPKTPEQNGVAERLNRTVVEMSRSMLIDAKLRKKFWAEAVSTAVYLKNRSPSKPLQNMTPYEAWHGRKPVVSHLRVFGCDAYAHIPRDERSKFDSKTRKCILLGYGEQTKGYRLYDPIQQKVLYSRDVKFNENVEEKSEHSTFDMEIDESYQLILDFSDDIETDPETNTPTVEEVPEQEVPIIRRSARQKDQPSYYGREECNLLQTPTTFTDAVSSSDKSKWKSAMDAEVKSLEDNDVWDLVPLPAGRKTVGSKWVYKIKTGADGLVQRYKARLVAQGYTQKFGTDYDETFCPVVRQESLRVLMALSVQHSLQLHQMDVTTAFLNGTLEEEVFMKQPEGYEIKGKEHLVCRLKKSIYGLKQSPRCWNIALDSHLKKMGFSQSQSDPCIYYKNEDDEMFYIGVYVDDIILAGRSESRMKAVKADIAQKFNTKDLGKLSYFLGMKVSQNEENNSIWIGQCAYTESLLKTFGMEDCKPVSTPVDISTKLTQATDEDSCIDQQKYQSAIGSLMYLSISTRPDISFAVSTLARFSSKPTKEHWTALKRLLRYLKGTTQYGILYKKGGVTECVGFSDADWAGDTNDRKSTSGYVFMLSGGAVSWSSKKQKCVALSTAEAEYIALSSAAQESIWLRQLLTELGKSLEMPTVLFEDNKSSIAMTRNPQFHGRAKHIDIKHHFIREQVSRGKVQLEYCPTAEMTADILTKALSREKFSKLRIKSGVVELITT